jgi:hypothetical protein
MPSPQRKKQVPACLLGVQLEAEHLTVELQGRGEIAGVQAALALHDPLEPYLVTPKLAAHVQR